MEAEKLFEEHQPLARTLANKYSTGTSWHEDMKQEAYLALWIATSSYDPTRGDSFRAHAYFVISSALQKYCQRNIQIVTRPHAIHRINRYYKNLIDLLKDSPALFEAGITAQEVATTYEHEAEALLPKSIRKKVRTLKSSITIQCNGKERYRDKVLIAAQFGPAKELQDSHASTSINVDTADVHRAIMSLPVRGALAFIMRLQGWSQAEIAEEMNLTKQRIGQILKEVRAELTKQLAEVNDLSDQEMGPDESTDQ